MITVNFTSTQAAAIQHCLFHDRLGDRPHQNVQPTNHPPVPRPSDGDVRAAYDALTAAIEAAGESA
jgi:hypothetical protein